LAYQVERDKWIFRRHTLDVSKICKVANELKNFTKSSISNNDKTLLQNKLKTLNLYNERNPSKPLDAINHKIIMLSFYMFGYRDKKRFLFSPLGHLYLKYLTDSEKSSFIFLTMLWGFQFPHPEAGTKSQFNLYPFRLIYKLLNEIRLNNELYAFEVSYIIVFIENINNISYEELITELLKLREFSNQELTKLFKMDEHAYVNAAYEWDYYTTSVLEQTHVIEKTDGEIICKLYHKTRPGNKPTSRNITRSKVKLPNKLQEYCSILLKQYPFDEIPLILNDKERLKIDIIKEIYSFYPKILNHYINEEDIILEELLVMPKLIERYSNNTDGEEAYLFEDILEEAFNMFINIDAKKIGGSGQTDIECLYTEQSYKFAVDAKSTKNKLSGLNTSRLREHREKIGAKFTIVVTSRYVPAVKRDIKGEPIVLLLANTFSEFLYNCILNDFREVDFSEFIDIIDKNQGTDISPLVSTLTMDKFAINN